jgi:hypothetical protein
MESGGRHLVLLAISGVQDIMTLFRSDEEGNVVLSVSWHFHTFLNGRTDSVELALLTFVGPK